ncbi:MAG: TIGR01777 family oxidoreductase [Planctomycetes bacterium]|nr:TIGR01777 family oxidoreductase [Planctomycetota bacterium]
MAVQRSLFRSAMPADAAALHDWHARPGAFLRLSPPWQRVTLEEAPRCLSVGTRAILRVHLGPFSRRWVAEHVEHVPGASFRDVQRSGPFRRFDHTHRFLPAPGGSLLEDQIDWEVPLAPLSSPAVGWVRASLQRAFAWRHRVTAFDLRCHLGSRPMNVVVSGSSGLVGSALVPFLTAGGHSVRRLVRDGGAASDIGWRPERREFDARPLDGVDAVVHLAGDSIADGRWNAAKKQRIRDSRVVGTQLLAHGLAGLAKKPKVLICASAIGFYGTRGDEWLDEQSSLGSGFLADVCREWEGAAQAAVDAGIRVVQLRFGVILSASGGALKKMLPPFQLGVGGRIGSGRQWMSFIALDDVLGAVAKALQAESLRGPVNVVAPAPVTNDEFTRTLGRVLGRPTLFPMPSFAARLVFGEMADELLLSSQRVLPKKLQAAGYAFGYPTLEAALRHLLGK